MTQQDQTDIRIQVQHVWKVFGDKPDSIFEEPWVNTASKSEVLKKTGHVVAIRDVSFEVHIGEVFVIMGLSGSGKSTLLRCLNCLIEPTRGEIFVDGESILTLSKRKLRELRCYKMGMVFQHFGLFPHRRVIDNVVYGLEIRGHSREERRKIAQDAINLVGLEGWEDSYPRELSGGMQQRVGLARALAVDPEILLFDEPFSALDPLIRSEMQGELINLQKLVKKTIIFITHDFLEAIKIGDRVAIMMDGEFVQLGKPEEIILKPATEYVKKFVRDVPRVKVLTAQYLKTEPTNIITVEESMETALANMQDMGDVLSYVIDTEGYFLGTILLDDLMIPTNQGNKNLESIIRDPQVVTSPETLLEELISLVTMSDLPIPVLDEAGKLLGVVDRQSVISSIKREEEG